jgi:hypothetical protein
MTAKRANLPNGRPQCQARLKDSAFIYGGPPQCERAAKGDDVFCGTHRRQADKRLKDKAR